MKKIVIVAAALVGLGGLSAAQAESLGRPCTTAPESEWLTLDELKTIVEAQGYQIRKAKLDDACGEIYALDGNGERVELFVDPTSGEIVAKI